MKHYKWLIGGVAVLILPILLVGCVAKSEYEALQTDYTILQEENSNLKINLAKSLDEIKLYEETFGKVYSNIQPPYQTSNPTRETNLINNEYAVNPTFDQLKEFILVDNTDQDLYITGYNMCGDFAEKLHNNAEKAGIKSALVILHLKEGAPHAINAFKTVDFGLVYIDSTGLGIRPVNFIGWQEPTDSSWDKILTVEKGELVIVRNLFPKKATLIYTTWTSNISVDLYPAAPKQEIEWESIGTVYDIEIYW